MPFPIVAVLGLVAAGVSVGGGIYSQHRANSIADNKRQQVIDQARMAEAKIRKQRQLAKRLNAKGAMPDSFNALSGIVPFLLIGGIIFAIVMIRK